MSKSYKCACSSGGSTQKRDNVLVHSIARNMVSPLHPSQPSQIETHSNWSRTTNSITPAEESDIVISSQALQELGCELTKETVVQLMLTIAAVLVVTALVVASQNIHWWSGEVFNCTNPCLLIHTFLRVFKFLLTANLHLLVFDRPPGVPALGSWAFPQV